MKPTLPIIQKMNMGEEDSIRLISKKGKKVSLKQNFEDLITDNNFLAKKNKKRVKQGDSQDSGMSYDFAQNQLNLLRRKDAENIPWTEKKNLLQIKEKSKGPKNFENSINLKKTDEKHYFEDGLKTESKEEKRFEISLKKKGLSIEQSTELKTKSNEKEKEKAFEKIPIDIESSKISKDRDFTNTGGTKSKFEKEELIISNSKENDFITEKSIKDKILSDKPNNFIDNYNFQVDDGFFSLESFSNDLTSSFVNHVAKNISQLYSNSFDKVLNSLDLLSIKNFENGFAFTMKLYPEELGELELFVKKEGLNLSLVAYVLNEEAKTVIMKDSENLTNFLMNQGYNLDQLMVEVKSDDKGREFKNFDKMLAENNKNFSSNQNSIEYEDNKRNLNNFRRFSYYKGIGRHINKYV